MVSFMLFAVDDMRTIPYEQLLTLFNQMPIHLYKIQSEDIALLVRWLTDSQFEKIARVFFAKIRFVQQNQSLDQSPTVIVELILALVDSYAHNVANASWWSKNNEDRDWYLMLLSRIWTFCPIGEYAITPLAPNDMALASLVTKVCKIQQPELTSSSHTNLT